MKKISVQLILSFIALLCFSRPLMAQTSIISDIDTFYLRRLINTARVNYPKVKSLQSHIVIAKENVGKAKASYLDAFTFSYVYQPHSTTIVNTTPGVTTAGNNYSYFNGIQVGLFFNLGNFLQKPFAVRSAKQELMIANYDREEYFLTLTVNVKKRYYAYILALGTLKLQIQAAQDAEEIVKSMRYKFEKGEETYDNYNKSQVTYSDRNQTRIQAESALLSARADLEELLGQPLESIK